MNTNIITPIAKKEVIDNCKNWWLIAVTLLFCIINIGIINFNSNFNGFSNQGKPQAILMSLTSVQMYLIPLFSLMISYDSILKERELGILKMLLSYPLNTSDLLLGKWLGDVILISFVIVISFIYPISTLIQSGVSISSIIPVILSCILLGAVFISIGTLISTLSIDRTLVIGTSIIIWLIFIFLFDLSFVLIVVYTNGKVSPESLNYILLLNPIDMFRVFNIIINYSSNTQEFYGIGTGVLQFFYCLIDLICWAFIPLMISIRKKIS